MAVEALVSLTIGLILITFILLGASVYQNGQLLRELGREKGFSQEGRLLFWQKLTLKLWVAFFIFYVLISTLAGGLPVEVRRIINLMFVVALLAQTIWETVITRRWRQYGDRRERRPARHEGGIPDDD